ncbi:acyltransferase family protein [Cupriavidus sp. 2MCAB6]|uniref:acyltransferase family protein n=1 Tax=Cupriavidus sp. 2MCAB6 TaxID=3232981 RepID=UPI003F92FE55
MQDSKTASSRHWLLRGTKLSSILERGGNSFDFLRLCAALAVMFGHSFWLQPAYGRIEPILKHTGLEYSGSLAVYTFFVISGMLVSSSYERQGSLARFIPLRLARIYPALLACVFLSAFVLYPILSSGSFVSALLSEDAKIYFVKNTGLFWGIQWTLPHIFEHNAIKAVINGSLWTLPLELMCYMVAIVAGLISGYSSRLRLVALLAIVGAGIAYLASHTSSYELLRSIVNKPTGYSFYAPPFFMVGMLLYAFRDRVVVSWPVGIALAIAYVIFRHSAIGTPLFYLAFLYVLLCLCGDKTLRRIKLKNDYSYGVYLWAFPAQQMVASWFPDMDNLVGLAISIPLTIIAAAFSWHLVEKPSIRLARKLTTSRSASPARNRSPAGL